VYEREKNKNKQNERRKIEGERHKKLFEREEKNKNKQDERREQKVSEIGEKRN
jgi:hypothetical protein